MRRRALLVLLAAAAPAQVDPAALAPRVAVHAGVGLATARTTDQAGRPQCVSLLEVDPAHAGVRLEFAAAGAHLDETSDLGRRAGAAAALNGGFFTKAARPDGLLRIDGSEVAAPATARAGALILDDRARPRIARDRSGSFAGARTALAAGPVLVLAGAVQGRDWSDARHPRSAVGVTGAGRLLLLAVDGRAEEAAGMTLAELATTMRDLGCVEALNLDGGGSTTLWVAGLPEGGIVNHPCDDKRFDAQGERAVADALLVFAEPARSEPRPSADELQRRIRADYPLRDADLLAQLERRVRDFVPGDFEQWVRAGLFDSREFDDGLRYPRASVSNLFFRDAGARQRRRTGRTFVPPPLDPTPRTFAITMRLVVAADAVPAGAEIRAWLPWPQTDDRQRLLEGDDGPVADAPMRARHLRQTAVAGQPTEFAVSYRFERRGVETRDLDPARALACPSVAFTEERPPHVVFSPAIRALAAEIAGEEQNPLLLARRCYDWCADHLGYSYAREYSTLECIPAEVLATRRGDCGMVTLLYMTLCRRLGIPSRWQSGWVLSPGQENMHDWCEIRVEPWGWIPVDVNAAVELNHADGQPAAERARIRDFFFGNLDAYRMVCNRDHGRPLVPAKGSPRSDDVDFQRGELEWGSPPLNLYFDAFDYQLQATVETK